MQDENQNPGYDDAQEPNNAPDPWGGVANLEGFEEFDQEPSGEEPADVAASKRLAPWLFGVAAEEASGSSTPPDPEADPFAPEGLAAESENPAASAGLLGDPALYDTGVAAGPWGGTPPPGTVEQEGESIFTLPWEDPNAQPTGTAGQEEGSAFNPLFTASWEDPGVPSPGTAEQEGESIFTPPWEDPNAQPTGSVEQEGEPAFTAPWEGYSTAPDPDTSILPGDWDNVPGNVPDTTLEGQEDDPNAVHEEILKAFDVQSDPDSVAEETTAAEDIWKDTAEGPIEDVSGAFEDVGEAIEDVFDDTL
jgi:hypothetical protein